MFPWVFRQANCGTQRDRAGNRRRLSSQPAAMLPEGLMTSIRRCRIEARTKAGQATFPTCLLSGCCSVAGDASRPGSRNFCGDFATMNFGTMLTCPPHAISVRRLRRSRLLPGPYLTLHRYCPDQGSFHRRTRTAANKNVRKQPRCCRDHHQRSHRR